MTDLSLFNPDCTNCSRLDLYLRDVKKRYPDYHARPVPAFGVKKPKLLIVGLAPGLHGANATGRPFTGDHAGIILYKMLHQYGFSNKAESINHNDGLKLIDCRITNAVKCLPPENKPTGSEINSCNQYLKEELKSVKKNSVILCLGQISHKAVIKGLGMKQSDYPFKHAQKYKLEDGRIIMDSYHCSRYNTQTKRLTEKMFSSVFADIKMLLSR